MMNASEDFPEILPDPEIVLICIKKETYYLVQGEEFLKEIMLVDGTFPTPITCYHFESEIALRAFMEEDVKMSDYWAINPQIIKRLRDNEQMIELDR